MAIFSPSSLSSAGCGQMGCTKTLSGIVDLPRLSRTGSASFPRGGGAARIYVNVAL
jgi:hypothetical protein